MSRWALLTFNSAMMKALMHVGRPRKAMSMSALLKAVVHPIHQFNQVGRCISLTQFLLRMKVLWLIVLLQSMKTVANTSSMPTAITSSLLISPTQVRYSLNFRGKKSQFGTTFNQPISRWYYCPTNWNWRFSVMQTALFGSSITVVTSGMTIFSTSVQWAIQ